MPKSLTLNIRDAHPDDLSVLHELLSAALTLDSFSPELLAEKLFSQARPNEYTWSTLIAEHDRRPVGMLQSVVNPPRHRAWVGLFAVAADCRRQHVATHLFEHARQQWGAAVESVEVLTIPGNYFVPGLDPRYTSALAFLQRLGFERFNDCVNLCTPLDHEFDTASAERELAERGVQVRRARPDDGPVLDTFFDENFGPDWRYEVGLSHANNPPTLHLAFRDEQLIAFSAHSSQNREWGFFGPMGTTPAARGLGIGRVLLWHCLNDLRAAGHRTALIPWVGPIAFYHQWAGSVVDRVFWRYRLDLTA